LNIISLAFLPVGARNYSLAILHLDHNQNLILLARDLILSERELSLEPSLLLPQTIILSSAFISADAPPSLVVVPPQRFHGTEESAPGGILVLGGRKVRLFELSSEEWKEKYRGRQRKAEGQKKNTDRSSEGKQKGREIRKRKAKATVEWPWDEVTAYVSSRLPTLFLTDSRWGPANDEGTRFCVGDSYGRLALLLLDSTAERTLGIIPLGEVQPML
jgi:DNA damage-binding protein 1